MLYHRMLSVHDNRLCSQQFMQPALWYVSLKFVCNVFIKHNWS